ncbi:GTPase [Streptomyces sp. TRM 70351]|uniref:GTPase n=1 Tax=Streptomyces sp. TRM 70351 TaxID=3116552 RepID=UPI002E7BE066|nr:GTPase [Streptomyces sp. TRM 70351]MEE1928342.1 GTPase [Streptomyces sp. TRM 70351]
MSEVTGPLGETRADGTSAGAPDGAGQCWDDGLIARRVRRGPVPVLDGGEPARAGSGRHPEPVRPDAREEEQPGEPGCEPEPPERAAPEPGAGSPLRPGSGPPPEPAPWTRPEPVRGLYAEPGPEPGSGLYAEPCPLTEPGPLMPPGPAAGQALVTEPDLAARPLTDPLTDPLRQPLPGRGPAAGTGREPRPEVLPADRTEPGPALLSPASAPAAPAAPPVPATPPDPVAPGRRARGSESGLADRLRALHELVGLSRTRLEADALAGAGRVLEEAAARGRLSRSYTTVAVAGPTGSGKSSLFNALAGAQLSEAGVRRPTTATPVACVWETTTDRNAAEGLLERLDVPVRARRRAHLRDASHLSLRGLVLLDLPDYDSAVPGHSEQVDRLLGLVDAVIWVVDPEKYADAILHERYLKAFAGHAEVSFVVLNQIDRLSGDAADEVLGDVRRVLDEDGMALGEYGEPGAQVHAVSALTGRGVPELREALAELVSARMAPARRLAADVDRELGGLRPVYVADGAQPPQGLTERVREDFEERLGTAAGATVVGQTAERTWLRHAERACGTPWAGLVHGYARYRAERRGEPVGARGAGESAAGPPAECPAARPVVAQAVRRLAEDATRGLPEPWARTVREAAWRGAEGLPEALDEAVAAAAPPPRPPRPGWWTAAASGQAVLLVLQLVGFGWMTGAVSGLFATDPWVPFALLAGGALGGPLLAWLCRAAARGPARAYGLAQEQRLRRLAAGCGRTRVLEPVAAELLRYREVRGQYVIASGGPPQG